MRRWTIYWCGEGEHAWMPAREEDVLYGAFCPVHGDVGVPVEVVEAALPDDQLREKVAEAIRRVNMDGPELSRRLADAAIEAMRGVSAAPAPPTGEFNGLTREEIEATLSAPEGMADLPDVGERDD